LDADDDVHFSSGTGSKNLQPINQSEMNDLVRDLGLTKENGEFWGSKLKKRKPFSSRNNLLLVQKS
jgi:hypothetical protein